MPEFHNTQATGGWQCSTIPQTMPNQYTAFRKAANDPSGRKFRWKSWTTTSLDGKTDTPRTTKSKKNTKNGRYDKSESDLEQDAISTAVARIPGHKYRADPLTAYPIVPTVADLAIIDYFLYGLSPNGRRNDCPHISRRRANKRGDPHITMLLPFFMQHEVLFHALLAACQASLTLSRGTSTLEDQTFLYHRSQAVIGLRDKLNSADYADDAALLSVTMLLTAEYLIGNVKAAAAHIAGLKEMVRLKGGLAEDTPWARFVKGGIIGFKSISYLMGEGGLEGVVCDDLEYPIDYSKPLEYPTHPFSIKLCDSLSSMPSGFSDLVLSSQLSTQSIETVSEVVKYLIKNKAKDGRFLLFSNPVPVIQAAIRRLSQNSSLTHIEHCICAGMLAFAFQHPVLMTPNLFHDPPLLGFIETLSKPHRPCSEAEQDAKIWSFMAVEGTMALRPVRLARSKALFINATKTYPKMQKWSRLEAIIKRFFYTEDLLEHWKARWQDAMNDMAPSEAIQLANSTSSVSGDTVFTYTSSEVSAESPATRLSPETRETSATPVVRSCPYRHR